MIYGCICYKCNKFHSNVSPIDNSNTKFICINCKTKEVKNGCKRRRN